MGSPNDLNSILDTSTTFDVQKVALLDAAVESMYGNQHQQREQAHLLLTQFRQLPDAWRVVGTVLENSRKVDTKFFALTILQDAIKTKWNVLPVAEKSSIPQFIMSMSLACVNDPEMSKHKHYSTKINEVIVEIAQREWPSNWPTFINDLCVSASCDQRICENNMQIMTLLSEQVFDFGKDQMTSRKCTELRTRLSLEFKQIVNLCLKVLTLYISQPADVSPSLISASLKCLAHYLRWIPSDFIFESSIAPLLISNFWDPMQFRIDCLKCLVEIFALEDVGTLGLQSLATAWIVFSEKITSLPPQVLEFDKVPGSARVFWDTCFAQLAICLTTLFKTHMNSVIEGNSVEAKEVYESAVPPFSYIERAISALRFIETLTDHPNEETFKICIDFWHFFAENLLTECYQAAVATGNVPVSSPGEPAPPLENPEQLSPRLARYQYKVLSGVRRVLIKRMAKPKEVYVNYDEETGEVERDYHPDTTEIALYYSMRETMVFLTNLGGEDMEKIMTSILHSFTETTRADPTQEVWNPMVLNRLCWAVGSISGSMTARRELNFVVHIMKALLWYCEIKRGKENKAIVATMVMYVVGQYPRFLKSNAKFLEVVIWKLFEFMFEKFPGVQQMACETFNRICTKCSDRILEHTSEKLGTKQPFFEILLMKLPEVKSQIEGATNLSLLYHSYALIVHAAPPQNQAALIRAILGNENSKWQTGLMPLRNSNPQDFLQSSVLRQAVEILRINERIADATGPGYAEQLQTILPDALNVYMFCDSAMTLSVQQSGVSSLGHVGGRELRNVKRSTLNLIDSFVRSTGSAGALIRSQIVAGILTPIVSTVFQGYKDCIVPEIRDHDVLVLATSLTNQLKEELSPEFPHLFNTLFESSLSMIRSDFNSNPDIRLHFYEWLQASIKYCFGAVITLPHQSYKLLVESLIWGLKHEQPKIGELGLRIVVEMIHQLSSSANSSPAILNSFAQTFYINLMDEIFSIMTDTLHTSGFVLQCLVLQEQLRWIVSSLVNIPEAGLTQQSVMSSLGAKFTSAFPNLNTKQIEILIVTLFSKALESTKEFQVVIRDFLVQIKEFGGAEELFEAERQEAIHNAAQADAQRKNAMVAGLQPQFTPLDISEMDAL